MSKENDNSMKGMKLLFISFILIIGVAILWDKFPSIKTNVHKILDPSFGKLLQWNMTYGMLIIILILSFITIMMQKYFTDQATLKELKKEQKILQEEMKKYRNHPEKMLEFQKKQFEFIPKTMELTMRPLLYTAIPFVLFFRWFGDIFSNNPYKFFGFMTWFWFYLLFTIIFSSIFRKIFDVA